jgi:4-hydroxybenzoate polyprenyltransferase
LSYVYSAPSFAWKGHPVGGPLVNALGYGVLSPLAGWWVVDVPLNERTSVTFLLVTLVIMATYFSLQAYQEDEDHSRGYRTLVVTHGPKPTLAVAQGFLWASMLGWVGLAVAGQYPRVTLLAWPFWIWWAHGLYAWSKSEEPASFRWPTAYTHRALYSGVVLMLLVFGVYLWDSLHGGPVAGLATALGHGQ